jgi:hypothetical protein
MTPETEREQAKYYGVSVDVFRQLHLDRLRHVIEMAVLLGQQDAEVDARAALARAEKRIGRG